MTKQNEQKYTFKMIKLDDILKTDNIRKIDGTSDLIASIKTHGIINPVTVTPIDGGYQLLAGFRRCHAAMQLNMDKIPCHVYEVEGESAIKEIAITENITRLDMTPTEECLAVAHLVSKKNTPKTIARKFGKSLRWVLIRKKIADAGEKALKMLTEGDLELSAAAKLADLPDSDFKTVIEENVYITKDNVDDILERFHLDLEKAPFDHTKCLKCAKCSACQCDLFADEPKAYCLDPACYKKKVQDAAKKKVASLNAEGKIAKLGKFEPWGLDHDDEDYDYELKSNMDDYKKAEDEKISKRIVVDPDTCNTYEFYDRRDIPGYVEESEEEIEARHEEEQRERDLKSIRCNMYKDRLQEKIIDACFKDIHNLVALMFINSDDPEELLTEDAAKKFNIWDEEENYTLNWWNVNNNMDALAKIPKLELVETLRDCLENFFGNLYYDSERMEFAYKFICSKDPKKLSPSDKDVQKEYDRQQKEKEDEEEQ